MKKQEKIQEAYSSHWEKVKPYVDENGWCDFKALWGDFGNSKGLEGIELETMDPYDPKYCYFKRPVSLNGINDNNGWIKIESEEDLPKEKGHYWVKNKVSENRIDFDYIDWDCETTIDLWMEFNTHYQRIPQPKPPIY
ncbi:hypothetical protein C1637_09870 [Chryseobacterium lactis]|uniref:DUF551 domain-containing protein n=1 Tax=Chryseobacterium lactis TaxID=1241981 RepID=A0A3G6RF70_CHRLC|nr:hypothetical protein [Chryseobacterium lactis]AZA82182.1 hypothetical protein EG342_09830 [Chryseobacterium lactis]AZB02563.1 hypothetical protein EG341_00685 [Chryseobacterium lactis]PNW14142.1 hypothetical protein C1637_09870 [Chryseobacterium lactis]